MTLISRPATALAGLALAAAPFLLVTDPAMADGTTKAAIEHAERQAGTTPNKAQIEHQERVQQSGGGGSQLQSPQLPAPSSGGGSAAVWQLALSAALGATLTGGAVVASRQMTNHRQAVAH